MKEPIKKQSGYSLIEMVVAVGIFAFMMVSASAIFQLIVEGQRNALAAQNIQESFRFSLEMMSKEIQGAQLNTAECPSVGSGNVYNTGGGGTILYLKNKYNVCVTYYLSGSQIYITRGTDNLPITPSSIDITLLKFAVRQAANEQPSVTMLIDGRAKGKALQAEEVKIQTTLSSRYYP